MPRSGPLSWLCPAGQPPSPLEARTRSGLPPAPSRLHLTDRPRHEKACGPGARGPVPGGEVTVTPGHRATWACHSHALAHGARQKVRPGPDLPRRQPLRGPGSRRDQCPQGQGGPFCRARHPRPADGCWLPRILPSSEQVRRWGSSGSGPCREGGRRLLQLGREETGPTWPLPASAPSPPPAARLGSERRCQTRRASTSSVGAGGQGDRGDAGARPLRQE